MLTLKYSTYDRELKGALSCVGRFICGCVGNLIRPKCKRTWYRSRVDSGLKVLLVKIFSKFIDWNFGNLWSTQAPSNTTMIPNGFSSNSVECSHTNTDITTTNTTMLWQYFLIINWSLAVEVASCKALAQAPDLAGQLAGHNRRIDFARETSLKSIWLIQS